MCSFFSASSLASVVSRFFNGHHSNCREMVSQCGFDLHFSNDQWWWAFFHMLVGSVNVFFWKVSVHIFFPLWNGFVCFLSCKTALVLCRFWMLALCQMGSLPFFFHSVVCQFNLMIVSFALQRLLSLIRSHLSILAFVAIAFGVLVMKSLPMPMSWIETEFHSCRPGWSAMVWSRLTATSTSWVQAILQPQLLM